MGVRPPSLADRTFNDLVDEVLTRIPAHTPEWTNPRPGDPGRTLIELFAWLADTILYRANLIPERQRLAFLRLVGATLRPAVPARGIISVFQDDETARSAITIRPLARASGAVTFETRSELTILPVTGEVYSKRRLDAKEFAALADVLPGLEQVYALDSPAAPYVTTPVFPESVPDPAGFDVIGSSVDGLLWIALLATLPDTNHLQAVRTALGTGAGGGQPLLNLGVAPALEVPALFEDIGPRAKIPHVWQISTGRDVSGQPEYLTMDVIADTTNGLTNRGVLRLAMPATANIGAPANDVRASIDAGVGDRPPRIDDPDKAERLVTWIRLRPTEPLTKLSLTWVGINAVEIDQRRTITAQVVGQSNGAPDQEVTLPGQSVEEETLEFQVEEADRYETWQRVEDLATMGRDAGAYSLDSEAGTVKLGDGVRGRVPEAGRRYRVALMRAGGGSAGNLPPGSLAELNGATDLSGGTVTAPLRVQQSLGTQGGQNAETLDEAERRVPALFRHQNRVVTEEDYRRLAAATPGVQMGRVIVMPRFKPHQRRFEVPGVVSVMVLPFVSAVQPPNPRPDRVFLETVHGYLSPRRPVATEMYVIGCEYVLLAVSVAVVIRDGFERDTVLNAVREALRRFLWPLPPGGPDEEGWPLGKSVRDRELEVMVARVAGVSAVAPVNVFEQVTDENGTLTWKLLHRATREAPVEMTLRPWQMPELLAVVAVSGSDSPSEVRDLPPPPTPGIAVPVVPEVC